MKPEKQDRNIASRERFMSHLIEITRLALKQSSIPDLFQLLANHMHKLLLSDMIYITLWDEKNQSTIPIAATGSAGNNYAISAIRPGEVTMTASVIKAGMPLVAEDVYNTPYMSPQIAQQFPTKSMLALPLIVDEEKLGAVLIGYSTPHKFTDEEMEFGTIAANQIALIVHKTKLLDQLVKNKEELTRINAEKDKLFSIIAHDLRSPFTALLALTRLIADKSAMLSIEEIREHAISVDKSARNVYKLLENLLEWSQLQGGRVKFSPECIFLDKLAESCVKTYIDAALHKNIDIKMHIPKNFMVYGDHRMLRSLLGNLISNALKFTKNGGKVEVSAEHSSKKKVLVKISDTGSGMDRDTLKKLFRIDKKIQSHSDINGEPSSGLGLVLCKEFVEKHKGKIWAESKPGGGSTIFFTLPVATIDCLEKQQTDVYY
jgi:K+-sensing histidine kinase KdpD